MLYNKLLRLFYILPTLNIYQKSFNILIQQIQFLQSVILYTSCTLLLLIGISAVIHIYKEQTKIIRVISGFVKYLNIVTLTIAILAIFIKFSLYLKNFKKFAVIMTLTQELSLSLGFRGVTFDLVFNSCILSDAVILLGFFSGLVCLSLLGEKNITKFLPNISFFSLFFVATALMVYTTNLLVMFISFELLFLPTLYFVYFHGYVEKTDKTLKILFYWTLSGAFLVLCSMGYVYFKYKTLNYFSVSLLNFSVLEKVILFVAIFIGFGVKVPVYPFHYWLTKIHVEAPAGFSIFLSGFLVKASLFCFFQFNLIFSTKWTSLFIYVLTFFSLIEASVKMWTVTDLKKLVAYATIQEMSLILFLLVASQGTIDYSTILFILVHGLLSTLMFLLVDIIQKKVQTRNIIELSGVVLKVPKLKNLVWFIVLLFSGFPLTVKFSVEWEIICMLLLYSPKIQILITFALIVVGSVGFIKNMLILMYGLTDNKFIVTPIISKENKFLIYFIIIVVVLLNFINLFVF